MNDEIVIDLKGMAAPARLIPGDALDLGKSRGVIVWLEDEDAEAWRLTKEKQAREIRRAIDFASGKLQDKILTVLIQTSRQHLEPGPLSQRIAAKLREQS